MSEGVEAPVRQESSAVTTPNGGKGKQACNGFFVATELEAISVAEENIAVHSLPEEVLTYEPPQDLVVYVFKNGDKERKIHCNTELVDTELEQLGQLQKEAVRQNLEFYPSVSVAATRYLSRARGDVKKALQLMVDTQTWRRSYFESGPITDASVIEDLSHGIVYFAGRDACMRPTLVCRANRIPQQWFRDKKSERLIRIVIFCMEYMVRYMLAPGKVEGNNLIVDLKDLSASQVPFKELHKLFSATNNNYAGRVFKVYVINLSSMLSFILSAAKGLLSDRQKQKLNFINKIEDLREDYALHQLEEDHGGSRPILKQFFPFPMQSGPFEAGYSKGPDANRVQRVDKIFTAASCRGRLWSGAKTKEENTRLEFAQGAEEIFKQANVPVPEHLAAKVERVDRKRKTVEAAALAKVEANAQEEVAGNVAAISLPVEAVSSQACLACDGLGCGMCKGKKATAASKTDAPTAPGVIDTPTSCLPSSPMPPSVVAMAMPEVDPILAADEADEEDEDDEKQFEVIFVEEKGPLLDTDVVIPTDSWFGCRCCTVGPARV